MNKEGGFRKFLVSKKGVSAVVATVLIILIVIAGVGIVWKFLLPMVKENLSNTDYSDVNLQIVTSEGYTVYDEELDLLMVQVKRGSDSANLDKIFFNFVDENGNSVSDKTQLAPEINQMKVYRFSLQDFSGSPVEIGVAPVFENGGVGELISTINLIPKGSLIKDMKDIDGDGIADNYGVPYPEVVEPIYEISLYSSMWGGQGEVDSSDAILDYELLSKWARFEGSGPCIVEENICMEINSDPKGPCWNDGKYCFSFDSDLGSALSSLLSDKCGEYDCLYCGSDEKAIVYETREDCLSSLN